MGLFFARILGGCLFIQDMDKARGIRNRTFARLADKQRQFRKWRLRILPLFSFNIKLLTPLRQNYNNLKYL